jgi:hypothetical protein
MKVKIKLPGIQMGMVAHDLKLKYEHRASVGLVDLAINRSMFEIYEAFEAALLKHRETLKYDQNKKISKEIRVSNALFFFATFNGVCDVYHQVICSQIEDQLFKSGLYNLPEGVL